MLVVDRTEEEKGEDSLVEAFYGSQHLNITARSGDEVDDNACASVTRGNCWCHAMKNDQPHQSQMNIGQLTDVRTLLRLLGDLR